MIFTSINPSAGTYKASSRKKIEFIIIILFNFFSYQMYMLPNPPKQNKNWKCCIHQQHKLCFPFQQRTSHLCRKKERESGKNKKMSKHQKGKPIMCESWNSSKFPSSGWSAQIQIKRIIERRIILFCSIEILLINCEFFFFFFL